MDQVCSMEYLAKYGLASYRLAAVRLAPRTADGDGPSHRAVIEKATGAGREVTIFEIEDDLPPAAVRDYQCLVLLRHLPRLAGHGRVCVLTPCPRDARDAIARLFAGRYEVLDRTGAPTFAHILELVPK
jgi:hypothetical protein